MGSRAGQTRDAMFSVRVRPSCSTAPKREWHLAMSGGKGKKKLMLVVKKIMEPTAGDV
jgi:hypothetical protein